MKNMLRVLMLATLVVLFLSVPGMAVTFHYSDIYKNWPGQNVTNSNAASRDVYGTPDVEWVEVEAGGNAQDPGQLEKITIKMSDRLVWDSLFISTGGCWDSWDYIVYDSDDGTVYHTGNADKIPAPKGLYSVNSNYNYLYVDNPYGRTGHANGIETNDLNLISAGFEPYWDNTNKILTYDFSNEAILLDPDFSIGYTPWCANDAFLAPVPEPSTMLLFGVGLICLAMVGQKRRRLK